MHASRQLKELNTIAVIPARGGSKGIPRKNLRPIAGKPLLYYSIQACLGASGVDRVVVSTDDEEIALFATRFGAYVLDRPKKLAGDITTLDPVLKFVVQQAESEWNEKYDVIVTVQPTSPLISAGDINDAVQVFESAEIDSVLAVADDTHLRWLIDDGAPVPEYTERVNRQQLPRSYKETGAVIACTRAQLDRGTRIGQRVHLLEIPQHRSVDIDTYADLALCDFLLKRKRVVFAVVGYKAVGLGHVYRALSLANELIRCELHFVCENKSDLVAPIVRDHCYTIHVCADGSLADTCLSLNPDLVINDILDTKETYIESLKKFGAKVLNFEDLGAGSKIADLVINALYPSVNPSKNVYVGPRYFCLRDEFLYVPEKIPTDSVERILLTFGGVDEGNLTIRCMRLLQSYCGINDIAIDVVTGPGYAHQKELAQFLDSHVDLDINWANNTKRISDYMIAADLGITSGGRTVLELAALTVPTIVICQNMRETTHSFASDENGVVNLGFRKTVTDSAILSNVVRLVEERQFRDDLISKSAGIDLTNGKQRVIKLINNLLKL